MCEPSDEYRTGTLVVGLGNPGANYRFTRHNAGFMVLDRLALDLKADFEKYGRLGWISEVPDRPSPLFLLKPATFMNRSGAAVGDLADREEIPISRIMVVVDDFALPLGLIRVRARGSAGGHNGLESIIATLGAEAFPRLRVGIGPIPAGEDSIDFVLNPFEPDEHAPLQAVLAKASEALQFWLETENLDLCMGRYNVRLSEPDAS